MGRRAAKRGEGPETISAGRAAGLSRRGFLASALAGGAAGLIWTRAFRISPAEAEDGCAPPEGFPASIELYRQAYENWAGEIRADDVWTAAPRTPVDVARIVNWAAEKGYRVRARGYMHAWAPLTLTQGETCAARVVLVDTTQHLTSMSMVDGSTLKVQTGASLDAVLVFLEREGRGLTATTAIGDLSIGGALAIGAHGTAIPARGETRMPGHTYGSLSNLVLSLTAVVWDEAQREYVLRTFGRDDPEIAALLVHVGRAFLTEVTLRVGENYRLRCLSLVDVPVSELFARPGGEGRSFASLVEEAGRVEVIWLPFTEKPWVKVWSVAPEKPLTSREVNEPYNYPFSDNFPPELAALAHDVVTGSPELTPHYTAAGEKGTAAGLASNAAFDLWGWSKNLLLYQKPSSVRVHANGYAVVTRRESVQQVVSEFAEEYQRTLRAYEAKGLYPVNGAVEIRVSGLDVPTDVGTERPAAPLISALRPRADHPEWDVAVWLNILTFPGTPYANHFYTDFEKWMLHNYAGDYAALRPEWSKGYAYTDESAWASEEMLRRTVPDAFRSGRGPGWDRAASLLGALDPHRVFTNDFLDVLLP